jgi:cobalt-zinc-cadmium efflux system outer membrane protein
MILQFKLLAVGIGTAFLFTGCATSNPKAAFDGVSKTVEERTGQTIRLTGDNDGETDKAVDALLRTNLTAQTTLAIAFLNNRTLQARFEEIGVSQAQYAEASRLRNPVLSASWRFQNQGPGGINDNYSLAGDFLELLTLPARKKIALQNLELTKQLIAQDILAFSEEAQAAFYTLQARRQFAQRLAIIVEVNEAAADVAQRQFNAGNINLLTLQNHQLAYSESRLDLAKVTAEARADREKLNRLMGLWGKQTAWQAVDELPTLPETELSVDDVEAVAVSRRLDLAAARGEVQTVAHALKLKRMTRYAPGVNLGIDTERDPNNTWVVGPTLDLEIPLFNQGQPELARLAARYRQARHQFEALAVNIRSEVRAARDALLAARDAAAYHQQVLLPQNERLLGETLLHYNAMQAGNFELLLAKQREETEEKAAIEALRDYWIARVRLQTALGGAFAPAAQTPPKPTNLPAQEEHPHSTPQ